jgi:hypothetical protein
VDQKKASLLLASISSRSTAIMHATNRRCWAGLRGRFQSYELALALS